MTSILLSRWMRQLVPDRGAAIVGDWLWPDLVAGLTTAAVVIPKAMAYADLAGLPPAVGLYTILLPMAVYVLFGSSRILSVSTTTTLGILTATALKDIGAGGDAAQMVQQAALLAMLVGVLLILAGILRLGLLANFISDPVLTGFKAGIGLAIIIDQLPKLIGLDIDKGWFGHNVAAIVTHLATANPATALLGLGLAASLLLLHRLAPRLPAPLIVVALSLILARLLDFPALGIPQIGAVPAGLPLPRLPAIGADWFAHLRALLPDAAGIALMSFTETIAAGRAFARAGEPRPHANRELLATGLGNLLGGLFGGMPAGGGTTQTAVNRLAGARSQVAAAVTVLAAALVLLFLAPLIGQMPEAALAAVVIVYSIGLVKPSELRAILRIRRREFFWAVIALLGVLLLGTMQGITVAVAASLLSLAYQSYNLPVYMLARKPGTDIFRAYDPGRYPDELIPGLLMLRAEGRLYFGNSQIVVDHVTVLFLHHRPRVIVFDLSAIIDIEYTALKTLTEIDDRLQAIGIPLWLAGLNPEVLQILARAPLGQRMDEGGQLAAGHIGKGRLFHNMQEAVTTYLALPSTALRQGHS
jgi:high affinity sulfate transporter 1